MLYEALGRGNHEQKKRLERQARWTRERSIVDHIVDKREKPIDGGIKDAVIGLRVFDIHTRASCEGHADWGIQAPWIDIAPERLTDLEEKWQSAKLRQDEGEMERIWEEIKRLALMEWRKTLPILDEFYRDRRVPYDRRLIIAPSTNRARLMSQGAELQRSELETVANERLKEYRSEMNAFGIFLKDKFMDR